MLYPAQRRRQDDACRVTASSNSSCASGDQAGEGEQGDAAPELEVEKPDPEKDSEQKDMKPPQAEALAPVMS